MQTIEMYFTNLIAKHSLLEKAALLLIQELPALTPLEIDHRCRKLTGLHDDLVADKEYFFALMDFSGPEILDTSYIGEFQRALDKSLNSCNNLYKELSLYRKNLTSDVSSPPLA